MLENLEYVESRCSGFRRNPKSVEPEWRAYFEKSGNGSRPAGSSEPSVAEPSRAHGSVDESNSEIQVRLHEMIDNFRRHGHRIAAIDPLGTERLCPAELKPEFYNFSPRELDLLVNLPGLHFQAPWTMRELFDCGDEELTELTTLSPFGVEGGHVAADRLLDRGATALVCGSDLMALGAIRAARARGRRVPTDVSVIGHDDSPLMPFTDPPLTTLRQPVRAMSAAAVSALVDEIGGHPSPHSEYLFRPELVVRSSTGPCPTWIASDPTTPADPTIPG